MHRGRTTGKPGQLASGRNHVGATAGAGGLRGPGPRQRPDLCGRGCLVPSPDLPPWDQSQDPTKNCIWPQSDMLHAALSQSPTQDAAKRKQLTAVGQPSLPVHRGPMRPRKRLGAGPGVGFGELHQLGAPGTSGHSPPGAHNACVLPCCPMAELAGMHQASASLTVEAKPTREPRGSEL